MHETIIVKNILEQVSRQAKGRKVKSITLEIGDLAHLPAEELKGLLKSTAGFDVKVLPKKAKVKCRCGFEGEPNILAHEHGLVLFECPKCHKTPQVLSGEGITLTEVKTE